MNNQITTPNNTNTDEAFLCACGETLSVKDRVDGGKTCGKCKVAKAAPITSRLDARYGDYDINRIERDENDR